MRRLIASLEGAEAIYPDQATSYRSKPVEDRRYRHWPGYSLVLLR